MDLLELRGRPINQNFRNMSLAASPLWAPPRKLVAAVEFSGVANHS